jgi:hypothetical protein
MEIPHWEGFLSTAFDVPTVIGHGLAKGVLGIFIPDTAMAGMPEIWARRHPGKRWVYPPILQGFPTPARLINGRHAV